MMLSPASDGPPVQRDLRRICTDLILRQRLILSASLLLCLVPARAQIQEPDTHADTIYGTVLNAVTHEPIGRALVFSRDNRLATLTDGEGHFQLELPQAAAREPQSPPSTSITWLAARKPGFLEDQSPDLQAAATPGHEITLSLLPEAIIKGRLTFPEDDGPMGLTVQLFARNVQEGIPRWVQQKSEPVNSNGEFRFAELEPGDYRVGTNESMDNNPAITIPGGQTYGFPPAYSPGVPDFARAFTIHVAPGQVVQADFPLTHQAYYPVRIPVTNPDANGMNVTVSLQGHGGPGYSLGYNAERQRIEGSLPNGNYVVAAATFNQNSATGSVGIVIKGAPVDGPDLVLNRNPSLAVNVREEFSSNSPDSDRSGTFGNGRRSFAVRGPRLYLNLNALNADDFGPQMSPSLRPPTGPNDDSLVLENLAPGRYWLMAQTGRGYVAAATLGGIDLLHSPFVVSPGAGEPIEITVRDDGAEIEGTLTGVNSTTAQTDAPTTPGSFSGLQPWVPQAWVYCIPLPDSPGQFQILAVSSDGKFNSPALAPGSYRILAFKQRHRDFPYRDAEAMKAYEAKGQVVHLSSRQKTTLQLQLISNE